MGIVGSDPFVSLKEKIMKFNQRFLFIIILLNFFVISVSAQDQVQKNSAKSKKKSFAQKSYRELQLSYGFMSDKFTLVQGGVTDDLRAQLQSINLNYVFQVPSRSPNFVFNYGFGLGFGMLKGKAQTFTEEVKSKSWFNFAFTPGIDYRNDYRSRIGLTMPIGFRFISLGLDDDITVRENELFSLGMGGRYVHAHSRKNSFAFSVTHYFNWRATVWDFSWQHRLGL